MTPKEKAIELVEKFECYVDYQGDDCFNEREKMLINAKRCALIAVDEIIESEKLDYLFSKEEINSMEFTSDSMWVYERFSTYWKELRKEINKL